MVSDIWADSEADDDQDRSADNVCCAGEHHVHKVGRLRHRRLNATGDIWAKDGDDVAEQHSTNARGEPVVTDNIVRDGGH